MLARYHYHGLIKKYISIFGTLFNNIVIRRQDNAGNFGEKVGVPLAYGPKAKFLSRISGDADFDAKVGVTLPRMGFDMTAFSYDTIRKLNSHNKQWNTHNGKLGSILGPVPYDITFELNIFTRYAEDSTKIIEQIMPFFTPEFTVTATLISEMNWTVDIPVVLEAVAIQDTYEADFQQRRALIHTLTFTVKGYLYGPISKSGIIKKANTNFYVDTSRSVANSHPSNTVIATISTSANVLHHRTTITPGLLANGSPTTNATASSN